MRGVHTARVPQERAEAHRVHDGAQLHGFAQSAGAGRFEARPWRRRRSGQFAAYWRRSDGEEDNEFNGGGGDGVADIFVWFAGGRMVTMVTLMDGSGSAMIRLTKT